MTDLFGGVKWIVDRPRDLPLYAVTQAGRKVDAVDGVRAVDGKRCEAVSKWTGCDVEWC